jgi:hypothetical protein
VTTHGLCLRLGADAQGIPADPIGPAREARRSDELGGRGVPSMSAKARTRSSPYWLIIGREIDRMEMLTINLPAPP